MRVAYVTQASFVSGAERSLQTALRHLPAAGVEPLVICPADSKMRPWCEEHAVPVCLCPMPLRDKWHALRWWSGVRRMRTILRRERIDLVHSNQVTSYQVAGAAGRDLGLPRVCHVRDEVTPGGLRWFCAAGAEAVVCISRHIERSVAASWPPVPPKPVVLTRLNPVVLPDRGVPAGGAAEPARRSDRRRWG